MNFIYKITDLTPQDRFVPPEIVKIGSTPALKTQPTKRLFTKLTSTRVRRVPKTELVSGP